MSQPELHSDPFSTTSKPLFERDDRIGNLLRQGNAEFQDQVDQHRALARLDVALGRTQAAPAARARSSFWSFASPAWAGVPLVALCIWFGLQVGSHERSDELSALHSEALSARGTQPAPHVEEVARLAQGQNLLPDGSSVHTDGLSRATWRRTAGGIRVELESGAVECAVTKQRAGASFVVDAGGYSFVVVGTELSVHSGEHEARLSVHSGTVEVRKGGQTLARVGAGETWRGPTDKASADRGESHGGGTAQLEVKRERVKPPAAPEKPAQVEGQDCSALLKNQSFGEAEACFALKAQGTGLSAELGLFELARVRSSALGNTAGAVQALEEHRRRFPTGVLSSQVQLALVRMLVGEKRGREALELLEPLIARGGAKLPELLRLRAELHRSRGECDKALPDYEALLAQPAYADEARRGKNACLAR
jgi:hypothetical protein